MIFLDGVTKIYDTGEERVEAVNDITLKVDDGEFLTILGPTGCGKSTILKMIDGLIPFTAGEIRVDGDLVQGTNPEKIAIIFQEHSLYNWKTVLENVEFGLEIQDFPEEERRKKTKRYIQLVGLEGFENCYPDELSGGMRKRVNLARALALETEIILADEPFGALDEQTRTILCNELVKIWRETDKTIVFVTHSLTESILVSDRIILLSRRPGEIIGEFEISKARPRDVNDPEMMEIRDSIWDKLKGEAKRAMNE